MKKLLVMAAAAAALSAPLAAQAQTSLGLRLGYAFAGGELTEGVDLSDWSKSNVPLQADLLFTVNPQLKLGFYGSYGFAQMGNDLDDSCDAFGYDCSQSIVRLGVQAQYSFLTPPGSAQPWIGAGTGWEWNNTEIEGHDADASGWELLNLQGGVDWKVGQSFTAGPFAMWSIGRYSDSSGDAAGEIVDETIHHWFEIGIRGTFGM
ncbi:MAG: outer membrane beta-barrel protein [Anaeromyxobacter sp.]